MVDFAKLRDPAFIARVRAESEARSQRQQEEENRIWAAVRALSDPDVEGQLADKERRFVSSCRSLVSQQRVLSERQLEWLFGLANRYAPAAQSDASVPTPDDAGDEPSSSPSPA